MTLLHLDRGLDSRLTARAITAHRLQDKLEHNLDCLNVGYDRPVRVSARNKLTKDEVRIQHALHALWGIDTTVQAKVYWTQPQQPQNFIILYSPQHATNAKGSIIVPTEIAGMQQEATFYEAILRASTQTFDDLSVQAQLITLETNADWLQARNWELTRPAHQNGLVIGIPPQKTPKETYKPRQTVHECGR